VTEQVTEPALARRLGLGDAVFVGLSAMIGAGVFSVFAPAAGAAGSGLLIGLVIAAIIAFCNATASAQLAAEYPTSGGAYVYGRERLGPWWGFMAGWSFIVGKTASCAAMALTLAYYVAPAGWERPIAVAAVLVLAGVNYFGVTRTALVARIAVVVVLAVLVLVVAAGISAGLSAGNSTGPLGSTALPGTRLFDHGWYGILQSAGLLFFAFAGYARIATMGEEVRKPATTIPRAIVIALAIVVVVYGAIAVATLGTLGPAELATSTAPLADTVQESGWGWAVPIVRVGAAVASLGALLALIAGVGRTSLAMARERDLPHWLAAVHPRYRVPHHADLAIAVVVSVVVLLVDVRGAIGFSSFGVLLYYFVANAAAFRQSSYRRFPRAFQLLGAIGCLVLVATLPLEAVLIGLLVLLVGLGYRVAYRLVTLRGRQNRIQ
jgi:basic amino acid/polyamine antiporter, APA family